MIFFVMVAQMDEDSTLTKEGNYEAYTTEC